MPEPQTPEGADDREARPVRRYPEFYEKAVPIALAIIGVAVLVLLVIVLLVLLRS